MSFRSSHNCIYQNQAQFRGCNEHKYKGSINAHFQLSIIVAFSAHCSLNRWLPKSNAPKFVSGCSSRISKFQVVLVDLFKCRLIGKITSFMRSPLLQGLSLEQYCVKLLNRVFAYPAFERVAVAATTYERFT